MANLDAALLVARATANVKRADRVRQEPSVIKAGQQFRNDARAASDSGVTLLREVSAAWKRTA